MMNHYERPGLRKTNQVIENAIKIQTTRRDPGLFDRRVGGMIADRAHWLGHADGIGGRKGRFQRRVEGLVLLALFLSYIMGRVGSGPLRKSRD